VQNQQHIESLTPKINSEMSGSGAALIGMQNASSGKGSPIPAQKA